MYTPRHPVDRQMYRLDIRRNCLQTQTYCGGFIKNQVDTDNVDAYVASLDTRTNFRHKPWFPKTHAHIYFAQVFPKLLPILIRFTLSVLVHFTLDQLGFFYKLLFHSLFKVEFDIDHFVLGEHWER